MTTIDDKQHNVLVRLMAQRCEKCALCRHARENPESLVARLVRFHGRFCPFWRAHERVYGN